MAFKLKETMHGVCKPYHQSHGGFPRTSVFKAIEKSPVNETTAKLNKVL